MVELHLYAICKHLSANLDVQFRLTWLPIRNAVDARMGGTNWQGEEVNAADIYNEFGLDNIRSALAPWAAKGSSLC